MRTTPIFVEGYSTAQLQSFAGNKNPLLNAIGNGAANGFIMGLENGISKRVSNYIIDFDTDEYGDVVTWMVKEGAKLIFGDDNTEVPMFVDAEDLKRSIYLVLR